MNARLALVSFAFSSPFCTSVLTRTLYGYRVLCVIARWQSIPLGRRLTRVQNPNSTRYPASLSHKTVQHGHFSQLLIRTRPDPTIRGCSVPLTQDSILSSPPVLDTNRQVGAALYGKASVRADQSGSIRKPFKQAWNNGFATDVSVTSLDYIA